VFGGRNTGDEYFMRAAADNFIDFDVLGAGRVVRDLSSTFDQYWNSAYAYPIDSVVPTGSHERLGELRDELRQARPPPLDQSVPQRLQDYVSVPAELAEARLHLVGARAEVEADPTDKAAGTRMRDRAGTVRAFVADAIQSARQEVLIISPYFIPGELGMDAMRRLRAAGVSLTLLTNSLASTDEPSVHGGYRRYRRELLAAGVDIYELSPTLAKQAKSLGRFGNSTGRLHAKVTVIDSSRLFIGSMNLDTRSERYNTELGVLIESPALAAEFLDLARFKGSAYRLRLDERGEIEWVAGEGAEQRVFTSEPETGWWLRLKARLLSDVVPEGWL
jgi:putative cardiolipin synthase